MKDERFTYVDHRGVKLDGVLTLPDDGGDGKRAVICAHGLASDKEGSTGAGLRRHLAGRGLAGLGFDFIGHGRSGGDFAELTVSQASGEIEDMKEWLADRGYTRFALIGSSFGGISSIMAASRGGFEVLALKSPVSDYREKEMNRLSPDELAEWKDEGVRTFARDDGTSVTLNYTFFEDFDKNNAYQVAPSIDIPTYILHGDRDEVVPMSQSEKLVQLLPQGELEVIEGADHNFDRPGEKERIVAKLVDFVACHFG